MTRRLREWVAPILVPILLVLAWWSVTTVNQRDAENRLAVVCEIEKQNIAQLTALQQIARELGLPGDIEIPKRSEECVSP